MMPMHRTVDRTANDDCIRAVVMPAPSALAIVVKRLLAMVAVMETLTVPIDDNAVVVVPVMAVMSVGLDDDAFGRSHSRRGQAKCQRAQNHEFHFEFSKKMCCPSRGKHGATALVPVLRRSRCARLAEDGLATPSHHRPLVVEVDRQSARPKSARSIGACSVNSAARGAKSVRLEAGSFFH